MITRLGHAMSAHAALVTILMAGGLMAAGLIGCERKTERSPDANPVFTYSDSQVRVAESSAGASTTSSESAMSHQKDVFGSFPQPQTDLDQADLKQAKVVLAGGCFWCTEAVFEQLAGVSDVTSGYAGGSAQTATYQAVTQGNTGHAEVIQITYDPSVISYGQLLRVFFATHDPTQLNRQGNDVGTQYRSAIFYASEDEKRVAQAYIKQLDGTADLYGKPIVTTLEPLEAFYQAELYHQDYARQNPDQPYIKFHALPGAAKARKMFPDMIDDAAGPSQN